MAKKELLPHQFQYGNEMYLLRKKIGREAIFKTEKALSDRIQEYFLYCMPHIAKRPVVTPMVKEMRGRGENKKERIRPPKRGEKPNHWVAGEEEYVTPEVPLTLTGLAVFLDVDRETLLRYSKKDAFCGTIQAAKAIIHNYAEKSLWEAKIASGIIFNLKNNWHWKDQSEVIDPTRMPTGYEDLTDEQLDAEIEKLNRKITTGAPQKGTSAA